MKKLTLILISLLLTNFAFSQNKIEKLDNLFTALSQEGAFNGNVLIAEKGKVIYEKSFGLADEKTKKKLTSKLKLAQIFSKNTRANIKITQVKKRIYFLKTINFSKKGDQNILE